MSKIMKYVFLLALLSDSLLGLNYYEFDEREKRPDGYELFPFTRSNFFFNLSIFNPALVSRIN